VVMVQVVVAMARKAVSVAVPKCKFVLFHGASFDEPDLKKTDLLTVRVGVAGIPTLRCTV